MLISPRTAGRALRRRHPRPRQPLGTPDEAAQDARERVWAGALEALVTLIPATVAVAFTVDRDGARRAAMAYATAGAGSELDAIVTRLTRLEPMDPFAVRHAERCDAIVLSADDHGGLGALARTRYGAELARHGLRTPMFAYLRRGSRIVAAVALVRTTDAADFECGAAEILAQLQPLLQDALTGVYPQPPAA